MEDRDQCLITSNETFHRQSMRNEMFHRQSMRNETFHRQPMRNEMFHQQSMRAAQHGSGVEHRSGALRCRRAGRLGLLACRYGQ